MITASLKDVLDDHPGVRLAGLEDRVRPGGSVYWDVAGNLRRVPDATVDGLVAQTTDILRYRMVVDPHGASFGDTTQLVVDDLARNGYRPVGTFDGWEPGDTRVGPSTPLCGRERQPHLLRSGRGRLVQLRCGAPR